jgi:hypothetical protein
MRPLQRPPIPEELASQSSYALLIDSFGPYCAISEEPLHDLAYVWDKSSNSEFLASESPGESWDNLLLLSSATREAWDRRRTQAGSADAGFDFVLPDIEPTFRLQDSPFVYGLEKVRVTYLNESESNPSLQRTQLPVPPPEVQELAIVRGRDPRAQATIDAFALNTEYFQPAEHQLRIPFGDYLSRRDPRLINRTRVWQMATESAHQISNLGNPEPLLSQLRTLAAATGYWSVWATVLWEYFGDPRPISAVLGPQSIPEDEIAWGVTPFNRFPGTAPSWRDIDLKRVA